MRKEDEAILVVDRHSLFDDERLAFQGTEVRENVVSEIVGNMSENFWVKRRGSDKEIHSPVAFNAELNKYCKQPIPYAVIRQGDKLFLYKRLVGGGEARLHNKLSLGVGGHMNYVSGKDFKGIISENLERELNEELDIKAEQKEYTFLGLINDDSNSVGEVHIGLLIIIDIDGDATVEVKETDQLQGEWVTIEQLLESDVYESLENWSKITVDALK
jgi:predicted NUDIX family phosphoesterase